MSYLLLFVIIALTATSTSTQLHPTELSSLPCHSTNTCQTIEAYPDTEAAPAASITIDDKQPQVCRHQRHPPSSTLTASPFTYDSNTGSAQAYKPNTPIKNSVCEEMTPTTKRHYDYKIVNRWLPWRSVQKFPAPVVKVYGRLLDTDMDSVCHGNDLVFVSDNDDSAYAEVWQALPDGTYSSLLSSGRTDDGTCRARVPLVPSSSSSHPLPPLHYDNKNIHPPRPASFAFETHTPGVTGALGGLGPGGWDIPPWKIPVIHVLIWLGGYHLSLIEIPIIPHAIVTKVDNDNSSSNNVETTYQRSFDWGEASFRWNHDRDELIVTVDIKMRRRPLDNINRVSGVDIEIASRKNYERHEATLISSLCQLYNNYSWWYPSSPQSFFTEPITLCRPSILNFFPL